MNPPNPAPKRGKHLRASDLRAAAALATEATIQVGSIAEGVHQAVWASLGAPSGPTKRTTRGVTGFVYRSIEGITQLTGKSVNAALLALQPWFDSVDASATDSLEREAVLAALNGVMGDRLHSRGNSLATQMVIRHAGDTINATTPIPRRAAKRKVLLLIHGLCMNDRQWRTEYQGGSHDHGELLARELGMTPIYLRYNTGKHISENGRELSAQLEAFLAQWPVQIDELTILAHSMGGLVARSACKIARDANATWLPKLKKMIFLGTPHHGAPLERAGNYLDLLLGTNDYSAPFLKLTQLRSAGITDLRYGFVVDAQWKNAVKTRTPALPAGVNCYAVAATTAAKRSLIAERLIGDGLVPLNSALGVATDPRDSLHFERPNRLVVYRTNHMALLRSDEVLQQMVVWLRE